MTRIAGFIFFICALAISCKPVAYFKTPNDVFKTNATVYLIDGTKKTGLLTVQFETGHPANDFIVLTHNNTDERISVLSIIYYNIGNDYYYPKKVDLEMNGYLRLLFVKRLTPEQSRMDLYELLQSKNQTSGYADVYYYFISLPGAGRLDALNMATKKFMPNFNEKMSTLVSDCPSLSQKILQKQKGYFLPQINLAGSKAANIYMNIITEYNQCK